MVEFKELSLESLYKRLGLHRVSQTDQEEVNSEKYKSYIKILYLPAGYTITVDFKQYTTDSSSIFFINSNQHFNIETVGEESGLMIYYNRDFYCVQIHDAEVACDGILFNNLSNIPVIGLSPTDKIMITYIFKAIEEEFKVVKAQREEMLRVYLKQIIILSTRLWSMQHLDKAHDATDNDTAFFRQFSLLVENHYREKHTVADYAELMGIAPKTLTHKLRKMNMAQPNEVIKDRIILEAKRLLIYTEMSAKQIAYALGYEDPAYFNRLFSSKVGDNTSNFRKKYNEGKMYN
ncbi:AraC family transcriptional regulator [Elizabethkingia ursingii]|jgi:AraC-like DNA-binding protein|uniref:helix-turn-helix domain-containing protein n=1 Tax=Elizabethkingia ursingii TaxID=1756150 RepID=UPI00099A62A4|nr:AraC family transcriptional regulator [Elizabethkingia ursingii]MDR2230773.1 AraC family transcriptional regulator [Flavobacteriaceae bacterium]OPC03397.1 AraC family transcriptional regulator [Elizabethkingia ursingii]